MSTTTTESLDAYIECALWAGLDISRTDESGNNPPLDENYGADDISAEALNELRSDLADFTQANASDLADLEPQQVGHDFYLTRNRRGAGFWDRGLDDVGDRLTEACLPYGTSELYPGDDGRLYLSH